MPKEHTVRSIGLMALAAAVLGGAPSPVHGQSTSGGIQFLFQVMPKLLDPSMDRRQAFQRLAQDWRDHGNDRYGLALEDFDAYLANIERSRDAAQLPAGWVPGTEFWLDDDAGEIVACVRLRWWLTPSLEVEGGHIGYDVRPSARGRGFGTAALGLVLPEARRAGLTRVRLTVDSDNLPSIRIIHRHGGVLAGEAISGKTGKLIEQYWIDTREASRRVDRCK